MTQWTRRGFVLAGGASLAACSNGGVNQPMHESVLDAYGRALHI